MLDSDTQPRQPALGTVSRFPSPPVMPTGCSRLGRREISCSCFPPGWVGSLSPCSWEPGPGAGCLGGRPSSSFPT